MQVRSAADVGDRGERQARRLGPLVAVEPAGHGRQRLGSVVRVFERSGGFVGALQEIAGEARRERLQCACPVAREAAADGQGGGGVERGREDRAVQARQDLLDRPDAHLLVLQIPYGLEGRVHRRHAGVAVEVPGERDERPRLLLVVLDLARGRQRALEQLGVEQRCEVAERLQARAGLALLSAAFLSGDPRVFVAAATPPLTSAEADAAVDRANTLVGQVGVERATQLASGLEQFPALKRWRATVARAHNLPAYVVFHDATLAQMAQRAPATGTVSCAASWRGPWRADA